MTVNDEDKLKSLLQWRSQAEDAAWEYLEQIRRIDDLIRSIKPDYVPAPIPSHGLEFLPGSNPVQPTVMEVLAAHTKPKLREFIISLLKNSPDGLTPEEVGEAMTMAGIRYGENTPNSYLSWIKRDGLAERRDRKYYYVKE